MKFKVLTQDWADALALVSAITPTPVAGTSGYLCVVRGERCFLYSEDKTQRIRFPIPVFDVEGEGAFVFPTGSQGDLRYVDGWVEFETGEDDGASVIWCRRDTGDARGVHKIITFNPNVLKSLDADFSKAEKTASFPVALLKEAVSMTRPYLHPDPKEQGVKPEWVNLQLFGEDTSAEANGYMLGCSINRTSYFYSPELEGKALSVYALRIPLLLLLLSKSTGRVDVYRSGNSTYFVNEAEQVLGWSDQNFTASKFGFYGLTLDKHMLKFSKASVEKELKYIRSTLPPDKNKAFWRYDPGSCVLTVSASNTLGGEVDSLPIAVTPLVAGDERCWGSGELSKTGELQCNVNLDLMIELMEATKHPRDVVLGIAQIKNTKQYLFRIIEDYFIDTNGKYVEKPAEGQEGHQCRTVRFVPSKQ